jgi:Family of unknown function (DUF6223)
VLLAKGRRTAPVASIAESPFLDQPAGGIMSRSEALSRLTFGDTRNDMIKWVLRQVLATAVAGGIGLAAPAAATASVQPSAVRVSTLTPERIAASSAAVVGLIAAVIGGLALARSAGRIGAGDGRRGAIVALVLGPIGLIIGGLVVATADGGLGTGNGLGGGVVAVAVGLIGIALGGLALARSRRTA